MRRKRDAYPEYKRNNEVTLIGLARTGVDEQEETSLFTVVEAKDNTREGGWGSGGTFVLQRPGRDSCPARSKKAVCR